MHKYSKQLAQAGLKIDAIKLAPNDPFEWSSGYKMPIYNDNRRYLFFPEHRKLVIDAFEEIIEENSIGFDIIGGVSTGGIPWGSWLSDRFEAPFVYIRGGSKDYGLGKQIEGVSTLDELKQNKVLVVEDLISTGSSAIEAITAVRGAGAEVTDCLTIFNYELEKSKRNFINLEPDCNTYSVLTYEDLLETALEEEAIKQQHVETLKEWRKDPFNWWKNKNNESN